jgi:rubrerythrin
VLDKLRQRLVVIREVIGANRRHRIELQRQLQELQQRTKSENNAQSHSQNLGDGVSTDPCLEQQNAVEASLATIAAINAQMTALEETLTAEGDLLLERLAALEACRLLHPNNQGP